jgi:hypothetical protein
MPVHMCLKVTLLPGSLVFSSHLSYYGHSMGTRWTLDGQSMDTRWTLDGHSDGHSQNAVKHSILKQTEVNQLKERKHVFLLFSINCLSFLRFCSVLSVSIGVPIECPSSVHRVSIERPCYNDIMLTHLTAVQHVVVVVAFCCDCSCCCSCSCCSCCSCFLVPVVVDDHSKIKQ